jgi:8-amino-7-oxononanoate synthase
MTPNTISQSLRQRYVDNLWRTRLTLNAPQGATINLNGQEYINFSSNDYLGLANAPELIEAMATATKQYGAGAGASHLVCGHMLPQETLEQQMATFLGAEEALLFSSGYVANLGVVSALADRHTHIFSDRLNHASLIDGVKLSGAKSRRYAHKDSQRLEKWLQDTTDDKLIVSDTVFSMDGDVADVTALVALAQQQECFVVLDEAHGFGVLGEQGKGLAAAHFADTPGLVVVITLGKAMGSYGAVVVGSAEVIGWLRQTARSYIYTTAMPPAVAASALVALRLIRDDDTRRQQLQARIALFHHYAEELVDYDVSHNPTPIQTIMIGDNARACALEQRLMEAGILARAIRPPTVPVGTARLRITLSAAHREEDIVRLVSVLRGV